ncbi:MAG: prepilin-type N-terminal cleavage/methylation domain-containing protein [Deltaproteobacteria bacterium]|nr:prepilin-type N-terminal cleavage/methylation domain-containing protein [Deltaproteobacteria bacterium]
MMRASTHIEQPRLMLRGVRHAGGFTLIEAMIAMTVLAFGLLTLAAMQLQAFRQGSAGRHSQDASTTAGAYIEQIRRIPWSELDTAEAIGTWTNPSWNGAASTVNRTVNVPGGGGTTTEHSYNIQWLVSDVVVGGNPDPCLRDVSVRVSWEETDRPAPKTLELKTRRFNWGDASC